MSEPQTLETLITEYQHIRAQRQELSKTDKALKEQLDEIELQLMVALDKTGLDNATVRGVGQVIKSQEIVPNITDWDDFNAFARDNDMLYLFQRRLNATAYRELLAQGVEVRGLEPTTVAKITVRKA
ncbi:hypothetical protein [Aggregatibacter kilianii]|uniref:hypothetical protein n=1 Tax=Aggregatibacter kilianii TaxID=2025884 RepID=UPI000D64B915|nr:hypothetical protein [Aggregatibacter kilianii]